MIGHTGRPVAAEGGGGPAGPGMTVSCDCVVFVRAG